MMQRLHLVLTLMIAISLTAAPCRDCRPKAAQEPQSSHDCCRKQAPSKDCGSENAPSCGWQPSDKASPESKVETSAVVAAEPAGNPAPVEHPPAAEPHARTAPAQGSPPHLYLLNAVLLI